MYFLNGDRIYIKPDNGCKSQDEQLQNCFRKLKQINSGRKVFKVNFFVDTPTDESYNKLRKEIKQLISSRYSTPVITSVIAQPPLTSKVIAEVFYYDPSIWISEMIEMEHGAAMLFKRNDTEILVGTLQDNASKNCRENAENVFGAFGRLLNNFDFPVHSIVRQWNYLENILGFDGEEQRYQEFNNVRSVFYAEHFKETGFPAATGIGMNRGGVMVEFVAIQSDKARTCPLDNPGQMAAYGYSGEVLVGGKTCTKTTPKFERARYLELFDKKLIFISGTASIRGEKTVGIGDAEEQTVVTIENIQRLYSEDVLAQLPDNNLQPRYGHARVYVKNREDFAIIKKTFKRYYGNLPVVYIIADICRDDLLVEVEGKVILR
jgi:enamine deaminase RidA (YjgF/YER057c/UK114 family)